MRSSKAKLREALKLLWSYFENTLRGWFFLGVSPVLMVFMFGGFLEVVDWVQKN